MYYFAVCSKTIDVMKVGFLDSFPSGKKQVNDSDITAAIKVSSEIIFFATEEEAIKFADVYSAYLNMTSAAYHTKYTPIIKVILKNNTDFEKKSRTNYSGLRADIDQTVKVTQSSNIESFSSYAYKYGEHYNAKLVKVDLGDEITLEDDQPKGKCSIQ
jgi:hypothetical protein